MTGFNDCPTCGEKEGIQVWMGEDGPESEPCSNCGATDFGTVEDPERTYNTTRFGLLKVRDSAIITLPEGPFGFPDATRWTFVDEDRAAPFRMFQSLDNENLAFVVVDPLIARPDYKFELKIQDLRDLEAKSTQEILTYCVVTLSRNISEVTVNLQGPILINQFSRIGKQYLIQGNYTTREPLIMNKD